jgi:hypothetical protein
MPKERVHQTFVSGVLGATLLCVAGPALAQDTVRFIVRSFIPKSHSTNPEAIKPVPGRQGQFMLLDVLPSGSCFDTDHREFSADPKAASRLSTDITIMLSNPVQVKPTAGSGAHSAGATVRRKCSDGSEEKRATASVSSCSVGAPAIAGNQVQVVLGCSAGNPVVTGAPKIDYGGTITYDKAAKTLAFQATVGNFPSFEAYASLNGKPLVKIFTVDPAPGSTPWALFDAGMGFKSRPLAKVPVKLD